MGPAALLAERLMRDGKLAFGALPEHAGVLETGLTTAWTHSQPRRSVIVGFILSLT